MSFQNGGVFFFWLIGWKLVFIFRYIKETNFRPIVACKKNSHGTISEKKRELTRKLQWCENEVRGERVWKCLKKEEGVRGGKVGERKILYKIKKELGVNIKKGTEQNMFLLHNRIQNPQWNFGFLWSIRSMNKIYNENVFHIAIENSFSLLYMKCI